MASHIPAKGNSGRSLGIRRFFQFLLLMGNRIYLNATQQFLINTGYCVAMASISYLLLLLHPAPCGGGGGVGGGIGTANLASLFMFGSLATTGVALIAINVIVPAFPRAARVASRVAYKLNNIVLGGPP